MPDDLPRSDGAFECCPGPRALTDPRDDAVRVPVSEEFGKLVQACFGFLDGGRWVEEVELLGDTITVDEVAEAANTISHEVLTSISPRARRIYLDN